MVKLFYITYTSIDLAHHEIFRDNVCKGGINDIGTYLQAFVGGQRQIIYCDIPFISKSYSTFDKDLELE